MTNPPEKENFIDFEALTRSTSEAESTTTEFGLNVVLGDLKTGRKPLDDDDERLTMGFTGGQIAQHGLKAIGGGAPVRGLPQRA